MSERTELISDLRNSNLSSLTDADAATSLPAITRTPRIPLVTYTSLADVWGFDEAATFTLYLATGMQSNDASVKAACTYLDRMLTGSGFDPQHPQVQIAVATLLAAQVCTQEQVDRVLYVYPFGYTISSQDITDTRALITRMDAADALRLKIQNGVLSLEGLFSTYLSATGELPTLEDVQAAMATALSEG